MCRLFETIKIINGVPHNLSYHERRFKRSRHEIFGIDKDLTLDNILLDHAIPKKGLFKCRIIYGEEVNKVEFLPYTFQNINSLQLITDNNIDYHNKYYDRNSIKRLYDNKGKCDDILIIKNACITDTSTANIVFFDGNKLITPSNPLLNGTKRQFLLDQEIIHEQIIRPDDLIHYRYAMLINAMLDPGDLPFIPIANILM